MSNHTDSAAAVNEFIKQHRHTKKQSIGLEYHLYENELFELLTEFAQKEKESEAQQFAEWKSYGGWHASYVGGQCVYTHITGSQATFAELYNGPYAKWKEERGK